MPSALGENVARLRYAAVPLIVLVFSLRRWRPLPVGVAIVALAVAWNVSPLVAQLPAGAGGRDRAAGGAGRRRSRSCAAICGPATGSRRSTPQAHWPAVYLADADIPIARGWFRQDDFPVNAVLYRRPGAGAYLAWLRSLGVEYVVLSNAPPDYSSRAEATLVRSGRAGLRPVFRTREVTIYRVPRPRPIVTGPGQPALVSLTESTLRVHVHRGGTYRIAVRYSPYWRASDGCLSAGGDGMLRLRTLAARSVGLVFRIDTTHVLDTLAGDQPVCRLPARPSG